MATYKVTAKSGLRVRSSPNRKNSDSDAIRNDGHRRRKEAIRLVPC